jgi:DNA-binding MarR family transcriptional regulator
MNKLNNKIKDNFTIIPNDIIRNKSLSDRARFIFCYMASMPDDWKFYQGVMAKELGYTKDTLRKYIEELLETGYLNREQRRETGKFDSYDYTLNFTPSGKKADTVKNRDGEKPTREKSALTNKDLEQRKIITNIDFEQSIENPSDFTDFTKVSNDFQNVQSTKVNPFTLIAKLEKEKTSGKKEKAAEPKAERQPSPTYAAFSVFCQTFESLSGAAYPTDQNGHYIMMPKDAGQIGNLVRYIDKIDRQGDSIEALKVFIQAAWNLNDKWLRANFTIANLYSQASKIFTAYQTTSPAAKDKAYNDRIQELLAERMAKFQD